MARADQPALISHPPRKNDAAQRLALLLERHRHEAAIHLLNSVAGWDKYAPDIAASSDDASALLRNHLYVFVDYLALYFRTGEETWKHLYVGEKLKQAYEAGASADQHRLRREQIAAADRAGLLAVFRDKLDGEERALLESTL